VVFDEHYHLLGNLPLKDIMRGLEGEILAQAGAEARSWREVAGPELHHQAQEQRSEVMSPFKSAVDAEDSLVQALALMIKEGVERIPVVRGDRAAGLIGGCALGASFVQAAHPWASLGRGVIAALVLTVLAYPLWSIGVTLSGAVLGFMILGALGIALNASQGVIILVGVVGAVVLGILFYQIRDLLVMLTTALNGAVEAAFGIGWIIPALAFRRGAAGGLGGLMVIAIVVLGAIGFAVQYGMDKDRRTYSTIPSKGDVR